MLGKVAFCLLSHIYFPHSLVCYFHLLCCPWQEFLPLQCFDSVVKALTSVIGSWTSLADPWIDHLDFGYGLKERRTIGLKLRRTVTQTFGTAVRKVPTCGDSKALRDSFHVHSTLGREIQYKPNTLLILSCSLVFININDMSPYSLWVIEIKKRKVMNVIDE